VDKPVGACHPQVRKRYIHVPLLTNAHGVIGLVSSYKVFSFISREDAKHAKKTTGHSWRALREIGHVP
jgi:hypothetical protein